MKNHRILVVEDEAIVAMDIEDRLTALGYQLAGRAASGRQALEMAAAQHPDLILMDVRLEGDRDGITTAREIRRRFHLPVIFLTAYSEDETLERAKLAEPMGYLLKPFEDQELKSAIEIALYKHQAEEEIRRLNRLFDVLSQVNQAVVHSRSREEVLAVVCRLLVERGEVDLAWIGWLDSATSHIKPVAHYGPHTEILTQADFYADKRPEGQGNPGKAIREGKPFICTTCPGEACLYPAEKQPHRFGFQACGSFPVRLGGEVCAVLNICVAEPAFFGDRETELLQEVALDLSLALDKQESEIRRDQAEAALRESENRVKARLDSILSPAGDIGQLELGDIIDTQAIQALMDGFYQLTHLPMSIIDLKGRVLVGIGWQDICTNFHRRYPGTLQRCLESDLELSQEVTPGTFKLYKCKNNLWDIVTPIMVGGKHLGNLFMGQFFFEDDTPDIEFFRQQARQNGFDEAEYLAALARVPLWSRQTIDTAMSFFSKLAHMISMLCHSNIKLARAVTEKERLLEDLRASDQKIKGDEQFLTDIFSSLKDGLGVLDLERNIVRVNPAMQKFVRTLPIEGRKCHEVYLDSSSPCQDCPVSVTLETGEVCQRLTEVKTIDGQTMFVEIYSYPLINRTHEVTGVIEYVRDVTAVKKAEATLKEMERQLLQAQKMEAIGTLAGGIAHDFNNILWAIMGYAEMASYNLLNTEMARQYLDQVLKASQRAKNLVGQILAFSRRLESKKKPIYLKNIVQEAVNLLRASLPATIEIRPGLESESPILADPTQMSQVIMNLGTNAFHAMEKTGGLLSVDLEDVQVEQPLAAVNGDLPPGAYVRLRIEDTGNGMDPAIMSRIFEPYFTTKEVGKGTGLGLATVLGIVKNHGGEICLESQTKHGTVFSVYFPIIEQQPDKPLQDQPPLPTSPGRILFIDDEPSLAELGKAALTRLGYDVRAFTNSKEALAAFEACPQEIDLVVTDLTMPHLTGLDLAKRLQTLRPDLPIIICTGYNELLKPEEVGLLGVREILTKPLGLTQLAETVKQALQSEDQTPPKK